MVSTFECRIYIERGFLRGRMYKVIGIFSIISQIISVDGARILGIFPSGCRSHHNVFRPIINTLIDRGHELVVITAFPEYKSDERPKRLIEIDVQDASIKAWDDVMKNITGDNSIQKQASKSVDVTMLTQEKIFETKEVQDLFNDKKITFDLIIVESYQKSFYYLSVKLMAPLILLSSLRPISPEIVGASTHALYYPEVMRRKYNNLTKGDEFCELYNNMILVKRSYYLSDVWTDKIIQNIDNTAPGIDVLKSMVDLMIVNEHRIRDFNRAAPITIVYLYGTHIKPQSELSQDIQTFLDNSTNGVIYLSFGTSVSESQLPQDKIQIILKVFSELPYNVLWKWKGDLPGKPKNVLVRKWFEQANILKHPKIKLFVTQGGLQSIDEAIDATVPVIGLPIVFDQFGNVEKVERFGLGKQLDIFTLTEKEFKNAVETIIGDKRYRENVKKIRTLFYDQPQRPLDLMVWWVEYVLRHGGARHLQSPAANLPWTQYYEVELVVIIFTLAIVLVIAALILTKQMLKWILKIFRNDKIKSN